MDKQDYFKLKEGSVICRNSKKITESFCDENNLQFNACKNLLSNFKEGEPLQVLNFYQDASNHWSIVIFISQSGQVLLRHIVSYKLHPYFDIIKI